MLAIIGGGPAGLSAAIRAKEEKVKDVQVIERNGTPGGILCQCIHHGFGLRVFKEELTGPEYAARLLTRARELGVEICTNAMVTGLETEGRDKVITYVSPGGLYTVRAGVVILAMGCRERPRGALGIPGGRPAGVYTAGTAQAMVNMKGWMPGKRVVVMGSGDIGLIMARRMTLAGARVLGVYELMPYSGGLKRNIVQCLNDFNIPLHLSRTVTRIEGERRLTGVFVADVGSKEEEYIPCDTLLLSVGLIPENELSRDIGVNLSPITGGAVVNDRYETSVPGVFSCGNVLHVHDLADNVTEEAYKAATFAAQYIRGENASGGNFIPVEAAAGVRYTVPSFLSANKQGRHEMMFRSDNVYAPAEIWVRADGEQIKAVKKRVVTPGEMETVAFEIDKDVSKVSIGVRSAE